MKKIILFLFVLIYFTSCKKQEQLHKITYLVEFYGKPDYPKEIRVVATPCIDDRYSELKHTDTTSDFRNIDHLNVPKTWKHEYWGLKDGDKVEFAVWAAGGFWFKMTVFIDDEYVSSGEFVIPDYGMYNAIMYKRGGISEVTHNIPIIRFTYTQQ